MAASAPRWHDARVTSPASSPAAAAALADAGRPEAAVEALNRLAAAGDAGALFTLAAWSLRGHVVPRDEPRARDLFARAAAAGRGDAAVILSNFVANGTGGPADWPRGLAMLRDLAGTRPRSRRELAVVDGMALTPDGAPLSVPAAEILCEAPYVARARGLFAPAECAYLAAAAAPMLAPALVVDPATGRQRAHGERTGDGVGFTPPLENLAVRALVRRIAAASGTDVAHGEPLQVLRYRPGEEYRPHLDAIPGWTNQRVLTVLVWLNEDYDGGGTWFPKADLSVRGRAGDALIFRNVGSDGRADRDAIHAGLPVTRGEKMIASRWIRERAYEG